MKKLSVVLLSVCIGIISIAFTKSPIKTITGVITSNGLPIPGVSIKIKYSKIGTVTNFDGRYTIKAREGNTLRFSAIGFVSQQIKVSKSNTINVDLKEDVEVLDDVVVIGYGKVKKKDITGSVASVKAEEIQQFSPISFKQALAGKVAGVNINYAESEIEEHSNESYTSISENGFKNPLQSPLSTFSIDVDAASYSNMRRFLMNGQKPPKDAVRIEEMINYFSYNYPQPTNENPFSINYEVSDSPWNTKNKLVHIGLQGKSLVTEEAPPSNIVFLIDVSGSMGQANKLPLLKKAFKLLTNQLRVQDKVAIVVYAGSSGLVLPSTRGNKKEKIINALDRLRSGGGTAGAAGLKLAYKVAEENFIKNGNNRIIIATDGDFNVGQSSNSDLEKLIVSKRDQGIFISVAGFGMGNYKDSKMEIIADKGNGNYAYIDNLLEAKKVFVNEFSSTLFTIAKDVKIQIEFNPKHVKKYRLIGYENRLLNTEDFADDKKDAGELGAGHTVTALYEVVPFEEGEKIGPGLKYQSTSLKKDFNLNNELATVKFRYKAPKAQKSKLITKTILNTSKSFNESSESFKFSSAVAGFGMLLRDSEYKGDLSFASILKIAQQGKGKDQHGYRSEFIQLVGLAAKL